ncbi:hypothetical protein EYF80_025775 [Liparis tanakae]|uniref:Uncharacterized protein n=1 Tax=Liparis tanakae TaxID=230148 RepID=A0A4Z2HGT3_9TELE|nr:hypothetical protein EYF80_025775 [Liparis tanakae]
MGKSDATAENEEDWRVMWKMGSGRVSDPRFTARPLGALGRANANRSIRYTAAIPSENKRDNK